jgi:hypothetical protein
MDDGLEHAADQPVQDPGRETKREPGQPARAGPCPDQRAGAGDHHARRDHRGRGTAIEGGLACARVRSDHEDSDANGKNRRGERLPGRRPGSVEERAQWQRESQARDQQWLHDRQCSGVQGRGMQGNTDGADGQADSPSRAVC